MADNPIQQLQEHINQMLAVIITALPTEQEFIQVQQDAQTVFNNFDGINLNQLNAEDFFYIDNYAALNQLIIQFQIIMLHRLGKVIRIMFENHLPDEQYRKCNTLIDWIINRWHRIEFQRDRTKQFLLVGQFASEQQLDHQGFDGRLPWRFHWMNPQFGLQFAIHYLYLNDEYLNNGPTPKQFAVIPQMAELSLAVYHQMLDQNPDIQQTEVPVTLFDYINLFQARNEAFQVHEDIIEDNLNLVERIAEETPDIVDQQKLQTLQEQWELFLNVQDRRNQVKEFLLDNGYATEDQLKYGYDGVMPEAFELAEM